MLMKEEKDPIAQIYHSIKEGPLPTDRQKDKMLDFILENNRLYNRTPGEKIRRWIIDYPWRFAFSLSAAQAVVGTLLFGTTYTHLFLRFFGG